MEETMRTIEFKTAKLASEKGLKLREVSGSGIVIDKTNVGSAEDEHYAWMCKQPILQRILREEYSIDVEPKLANQEYKKSYYFGVYTYNGVFREQIHHTNVRFDTYEEALEFGLFVALTKIK